MCATDCAAAAQYTGKELSCANTFSYCHFNIFATLQLYDSPLGEWWTSYSRESDEGHAMKDAGDDWKLGRSAKIGWHHVLQPAYLQPKLRLQQKYPLATSHKPKMTRDDNRKWNDRKPKVLSTAVEKYGTLPITSTK